MMRGFEFVNSVRQRDFRDLNWRHKTIVSLTAFVLIGVGVVVGCGWVTDDPGLIEWRSHWGALEFNTAIGFALIGLGAWSVVYKQPQVARVCAVLVILLGAATAAQNLFHIDLGIDELFVRASGHSAFARAQMPPVAAGLFVMCGAGLALSAFESSRARATVVGLLASIVAGVAVTALIGYATRTPVAYVWGESGIAVHAAGSFVVAAFALGMLATRPEERFLPRWAPWAALIAGLACTISLGAALFHQFAEAPQSRAPELTLLIGAGVSLLTAWALYSRRQLAASLAAIAHSEETVRNILEAAPDAMLIVDDDGRIALTNNMTERQFGYSRHELIGAPVEMLMPEQSRAAHVGLRKGFTSQSGARFMNAGRQLVAQRRDGSQFSVEIALSPVNLRGRHWTVAAVRDITLRRQTEQRLRDSLQEKEILLKEIHHRVKNNLQVVASMLALQADKADAAQVRAPLEDCRQRVISMALVHEKLYGAADLRRIDLGDLSREIAMMLMSEGIGPAITTRFDVEPIAIDIDRAVPASLILNELITNAMKHAFKGRTSGMLSVSVRRENGGVRLEVADDGVGGFPADGFQKGRTLGMTIVRNLVRQLDARLTVAAGDAGTSIAVTFPIREEVES
jgi:PAS domain S-box-containing protein